MTPIEKSEAFWPFGKIQKENNANYTGAVANVNNKATTTQSITVVSPNGGEVLQGGKVYTIKWKTKGFDKQAIIAITLLQTKGETETGTVIAENLNNKGSYLWKVPVNISGNDFLIQINIKGKNTSSWDMSDGFFSIMQKGQNKELKVIQGEQPMATIFPKGSMLPFTNFIINPQGLEVELKKIVVLGDGIPLGGIVEVMLVGKRLNIDDKLAKSFYESKTLASGMVESNGTATLVPSITNFSFNQPIEFSIVGVRRPYGYDDGLQEGKVFGIKVIGVEATDLNSGRQLIASNLSIKGASHTINNSFRVGSVTYDLLKDLSNEGYLKIYVPSSSSEKAMLKSLYLVAESNWETKDIIATIKNNNNEHKISSVCKGVINGMFKCSFDDNGASGVLMEQGSSFNITVNQNGGINFHPAWFDLIVDGYAYKYRLYLDTGKACFLAGTKIDMTGGTKKNIEEIKIGDYVKSLNTETGKTNNAKVVRVIRKTDPSHLTINNLLKTVPDQKMFTKEGFKQAQDLKIGDYLLSNDNNWIKVSDISPIVNESVETYDLVLNGGNTFYADGYLAHSVEE